MKKRNSKKAIDYLTIATELSKYQGTNFDFSDLIEHLKGTNDKESRKPYFKMKESEFENDIEEYYGVEIDEITEFIIETEMNVQEACKQLGKTEEEINIINLLYAREYYSQGQYKKGDEFLSVVEKQKNKSDFVKKFLEDIRRNKKFYINRNEKETRLTLKIRP